MSESHIHHHYGASDDELCRLECQLRELRQQVKSAKEEIMSAISDFAAKQNAHNDKIDASITDLQGDVKTLNDTIAQLQGSSGTITPEDQALLDALDTRAQGISDKLDALDALTPPTPPAA